MASTIWKGRLNFGLVSIPIKLFRAARPEKIHMHKFQRETGARVRQVFVPAVPAPMGKAPHETAASERIPSEKPAPATMVPSPVDARPAAPQISSKRKLQEARLAEIAPEPTPPSPPEVSDDVDTPRRTVELTPRGDRVPSPDLSPADIVHGYEYEKGKYVHFEAGELEKIAPKASADMQIVEFVHFNDIDPVYLETSYYIAPDRGGEKPYALLFETLRKTGYAAIGEFVMHRRDQIIILRPGHHGLIGHTLFYEDEVKRENEYHAEAKLIGGKEMDLAVKLVEALAAEFEPARFKDAYRERLREAISSKIDRGAVTEAPAEEPARPVVDIMAALQESLTRARKPVAREDQAPAAKKPKRAGGK